MRKARCPSTLAHVPSLTLDVEQRAEEIVLMGALGDAKSFGNNAYGFKRIS